MKILYWIIDHLYDEYIHVHVLCISVVLVWQKWLLLVLVIVYLVSQSFSLVIFSLTKIILGLLKGF